VHWGDASGSRWCWVVLPYVLGPAARRKVAERCEFGVHLAVSSGIGLRRVWGPADPTSLGGFDPAKAPTEQVAPIRHLQAMWLRSRRKPERQVPGVRRADVRRWWNPTGWR